MRSFCHSKIPVTATEFAIVFEAIPSVIMFMKGFNFYLNVFEMSLVNYPWPQSQDCLYSVLARGSVL